MPARPASSIYLGCLQHGVRASPDPERGAPNPPEEPGAAPSPHHPLGTVLGHGDSRAGTVPKVGRRSEMGSKQGLHKERV